MRLWVKLFAHLYVPWGEFLQRNWLSEERRTLTDLFLHVIFDCTFHLTVGDGSEWRVKAGNWLIWKVTRAVTKRLIAFKQMRMWFLLVSVFCMLNQVFYSRVKINQHCGDLKLLSWETSPTLLVSRLIENHKHLFESISVIHYRTETEVTSKELKEEHHIIFIETSHKLGDDYCTNVSGCSWDNKSTN